ncbi:MAG: hypothetical protein PHX54_03950 [Lentimicrobiaceae bacterium]|nr:hypothetical protein [Lentimicrobiaceae bacterium]
MDEKVRQILSGVRDIAFKSGVKNLHFKEIALKLNIDEQLLESCFTNEAHLIERLLEIERESFKSIFDEYNFEHTNAIEILLIVSEVMSIRFLDLSPSVTFELKQLYPEVYQTHLEQRIDFVYNKMKINIEKGIRQGVYREDVSIELLARLYISRLIDLNNFDFFPPERFSFKLMYEVMFDNFIRGIANDEGLKYYKKRRRFYKLFNAGN